MTVSFNEIPKNGRVPATFIEFDNSNAVQGATLMPFKGLIFGQKLTAGTAEALKTVKVTSKEQAKILFGKGSQLEMTVSAQLEADNSTEITVLPLEDNQAAVAATGEILIDGEIKIGTLSLYIAPFYEGSSLRGKVTVASRAGMTSADLATALAAAINVKEDLPVTASATENKVLLTAKNKGEVGNNIAVCLNYFDGEELPSGLSLTFNAAALVGSLSPSFVWTGTLAGTVAFYGNQDPARPFQTLTIKGVLPPKKLSGMLLKGGATNPDVSNVFAKIGDEQYHIVTCPYTDLANLTAIAIELKDRRTATRQIDGMCFCAVNGTHAEMSELGDSLNSEDICIIGTGGSFTMQEKNLLLHDGISTYAENADSTVSIQRLITTYKTNTAGAEDTSYLDVNTLLTLSYLRYDFKNYIMRKYPRHKLANDGTMYGLGQSIITPKIGKAEAIVCYRNWMELGLVENAEGFKAGLICVRDKQDPNRLNFVLPVDLINQLRVSGVKIAFTL